MGDLARVFGRTPRAGAVRAAPARTCAVCSTPFNVARLDGTFHGTFAYVLDANGSAALGDALDGGDGELLGYLRTASRGDSLLEPVAKIDRERAQRRVGGIARAAVEGDPRVGAAPPRISTVPRRSAPARTQAELERAIELDARGLVAAGAQLDEREIVMRDRVRGVAPISARKSARAAARSPARRAASPCP